MTKDLIEETNVNDEKALAEHGENGLPQTQYHTTMPEDLGPDEIATPRLKLAQGLTSEVQDGLASAGQWILAGYPAADELVAIPVAFAKRRERRDPDTRGILCFAPDGKHGQGNPGIRCGKCPFAKWTKNDSGKSSPPECELQYNYIFFIPEYDALGVATFSKTSLRDGKKLNAYAVQKGLGQFAVSLSSKSRKNSKGTFYIPVIRPTEIEDEDLDRAVEFTAAL